MSSNCERKLLDSLLALLLLITVLGLESVILMGDTQQAGVVTFTDGDGALWDTQDHSEEISTMETSENNWRLGRRMLLENDDREVMKDKRTKPMVTNTVKTGAASSDDGELQHREKGKLIHVELKNRVIPSRAKSVGPVPFSCDYRPPKTHPPKNN